MKEVDNGEHNERKLDEKKPVERVDKWGLHEMTSWLILA